MSATCPVSALILEYRNPERTIACVQSLLDDGVRDVLVVDNSDDEGSTWKILQGALDGMPEVCCFRARANLGFAAGVNLGLGMLRAERVIIINNDAVVTTGAVAALSSAVDADRKVVVAFPKLIHCGQVLEEVHYHRWIGTLSSRAGVGKFSVPRGCCMLLALDRLGPGPLFDEDFFMYGEEIELGWKIKRLGFGMVYVPDATVVHEGSVSAVLGSPFYEFHTARAHVLLGAKLSGSWRESLALVPTRLLAIFARSILRSVRARSLLPLLALVKALKARS